jgi:ParB-like chromosome segregation protein Spo0J
MTLLDDPRLGQDGFHEPAAEICLDDLCLRPSRRRGGIDAGHVRALQELGGRWPPILVASSDRTVVDGLHRVHAARALGLTHLPCVFFAGGEEEIYTEFVRRNASHGLPLSLEEREAAARRMLRTHPEWSDRRVASTCSLSPGTVARVRRASEGGPGTCATEPRGQLRARVGRDGRSRPLDRRELRLRIAEVLRANPGASLRGVAAQVGASPGTVRSVRAQIGLGTEAGERALEQGAIACGAWEGDEQAWLPDCAVLSTDEGSDFAVWFTRTAVTDGWQAYLAAVPYSRIYDVADEARRRAAHWADFARALEARSRRG